MTLEIISTPPSPAAFIPLTAHEAQTPDSFFGGKPVLHYHDQHTRVIVSRRQSSKLPIYRPRDPHDDEQQQQQQQMRDSAVNGQTNGEAAASRARDEDDDDEEVEVSEVNLWVTSEKVTLYNPSISTGVSISYPAIVLHAIQRSSTGQAGGSNAPEAQQSLYMQILVGSGAAEDMDDDEDDNDILDLKLIPSGHIEAAQSGVLSIDGTATSMDPASDTRPEPGADEESTALPSTNNNNSPIQRLFAAISYCSNLHPDPSGNNEGEEDGEGGADDRIMFEGSVGYQSSIVPPFNSDPFTTAGAAEAAASNAGGTSDLPPPFPGSSGWITAENVDEYFDKDGNWLGGGGAGDEGVSAEDGSATAGLGPGAGRVRLREDDNDEGDEELVPVDGGEGVGGAADGNGSYRHDGDGGDDGAQAKWRRTG